MSVEKERRRRTIGKKGKEAPKKSERLFWKHNDVKYEKRLKRWEKNETIKLEAKQNRKNENGGKWRKQWKAES